MWEYGCKTGGCRGTFPMEEGKAGRTLCDSCLNPVTTCEHGIRFADHCEVCDELFERDPYLNSPKDLLFPRMKRDTQRMTEQRGLAWIPKGDVRKDTVLKLTRSETIARNDFIVAAIRSGSKPKDLIDEVGLSECRIRDIYKARQRRALV